MSDAGETVILIHGLWMHGLVFLPHQRRLRQAGFVTQRFSYPSWSRGMTDNTRRLAGFIATLPVSGIHLVAHSLGGPLALTLLGNSADSRIRRLVMMGSPCAACHCGSTLAAQPALAPLIGRTVKDWLAQPRPAIPASVEVGVIAGTLGIGLGRVVPGLPLPNDGTIALAETRVPEAKDSIALAVSHTGMLMSASCAEQVASFLKNGHFIHA